MNTKETTVDEIIIRSLSNFGSHMNGDKYRQEFKSQLKQLLLEKMPKWDIASGNCPFCTKKGLMTLGSHPIDSNQHINESRAVILLVTKVIEELFK